MGNDGNVLSAKQGAMPIACRQSCCTWQLCGGLRIRRALCCAQVPQWLRMITMSHVVAMQEAAFKTGVLYAACAKENAPQGKTLQGV